MAKSKSAILPPLQKPFKSINVGNLVPIQKAKFTKESKRMFTDNCILINPNVDSSDKEVLVRNNFRSNSKNLTNFARNGSMPNHAYGIYRPS